MISGAEPRKGCTYNAGWIAAKSITTTCLVSNLSQAWCNCLPRHEGVRQLEDISQLF